MGMTEVPLIMTMPQKAPGKAAVTGGGRVMPNVTTDTKHSIKSAVHHELIKRVDLEKLAAMQDDLDGRSKLLSTISQLVGEQDIPLSALDRESLAQEVMNEVFGLGPLEPLLNDPTVSEILVNTHRIVYVERKGVLGRSGVVFRDNTHLMHIIDKIVSTVGRRIDESSPMVDARLLDGSRVNIVIPPLAVDGPLISIRKFPSSPLGAEDLLRFRALTPQMLEVLKAAVKAHLNIVVSGGTGAGKTTLLNVLSGFIAPNERIVTIEDSAELQIQQEHVARLECRPPNVEGKGAIRQRELVINSLRMRPDRIILGEIRGEEALDMLQAMNTGHDGSITTVHANNPREAIARLETMCLMGSVALPEKAIRTQIGAAIHLIVQQTRLSDGSRRVTHISEITGATSEVVSMQDIFVFEKQGLTAEGKVKGRFYATGIVPKFSERLKAAGIPLPLNAFEHSVEV